MRILFYGDSITDMHHDQSVDGAIYSYGSGYPFVVMSKLSERNPNEFFVINRGIGGNRITDLYSRIKRDVWNLKPDVLSILVGVNDVWHELEPAWRNGVDIDRFDRMYRMLLDDTMKVIPDTKIMLCEPFILHGKTTDLMIEGFSRVFDYAKVVRQIAKDYNLPFVELQKPLSEAAEKYGPEPYLYDGVHPMVAGATLIANEWIKVFDKEILKK